MFKKLLSALLLMIGAAFGQGAQRTPTAQTWTNIGGYVRVLSGAQVTVCASTGSVSNCNPTVSLFSNVGLSSPITNPLYADANGNFTYYVSPGTYGEKICSPGVACKFEIITLGGGGGGGATPGGPITSVQVNLDNNNFAGYSEFEYSHANQTLTLPTLVATDIRAAQFPVIDVREYGAVGDAVTLENCSMTVSQHTLSCPDPLGRGFDSSSVGKVVGVQGAGPSDNPGSWLITTISGFTSSTTVTVTAAAVNTVSNQNAIYGTDNYTAFCAATLCTQAIYTGTYGNGILTGRNLYFPGGQYLTTHPVYVRGNMIATGGGQAATQIVLLDKTNSVSNVSPNWNTVNIAPGVCLNGNATAGMDTCSPDAYPASSGSNGAYDLLVSTLATYNPSFLSSNVGGGGAGGSTYLHNVWSDSNYGIVFYNVSLNDVDNLTCDVGCNIGVLVTGGSHTINIHDSYFFANLLPIWIDGGYDITIDNIKTEGATSGTIYVYSPTAATTTGLKVLNSTFNGPSAVSYPSAHNVDFETPCVDCQVIGDTFTGSPTNDVGINTTVTNLLLAHNVSLNAGGTSFFTTGSARGNLILDTNTFDTPGQYGASLSIATKLVNNVCRNPFAVTPPLGGGSNAYQNGCFYFSGTVTPEYAFDARGNSVTSSGGTKYPAVSLNDTGVPPTISGITGSNSSDYSGCTFCAFSTSPYLIVSTDSATNAGVSGAALFAPSSSAGGFSSSGTTFAGLGTPANGEFLYCVDCTITNPCAGSGAGAWASREGGVWNCGAGTSTGGTVTSVAVGALSPLFTASVINPTTNVSISFTLSNFVADAVFGNFSGSPASPSPQVIPACANDGLHALVYPSHGLICETIAAGTITPSPQFELPYYSAAGTASTIGGDSKLITDGSGNLSVNSLAITATTPGAWSWTAGSGSIPSLPSNSGGFAAPASGGTSWLAKLPQTAAAGIWYFAAPATNDGVNETAITIIAPSGAKCYFFMGSGGRGCDTPAGSGTVTTANSPLDISGGGTTVGSYGQLSGTDTGSANAYNVPTLTVGDCPANYAALPIGTIVTFTPAHNSTSTGATLDICGFGVPKNVDKNFDNNTSATAFLTNNVAILVWGGTAFQLLNDANNIGNLAFSGTQTQNYLTKINSSLGAADVVIGSISDTGTSVSPGTVTTLSKFLTPADESNGTTFSSNSGCSENTLVGGSSAGSLISGSVSCTFTITIGGSITAPHGWACYMNDLTTPADVMHQSGSSTTTATFTGTTVIGDALNFGCKGY